MSATLVVLPRFLDARTGTGQRSRLLVEGAALAGPAHVAVLGGGAALPDGLPHAASVTGIRSDRIMPPGRIARLIGGRMRLLSPGRSYRVEPALRRALLDLARETGADRVIFRYAHLHAISGLGPEDGLRVIVDVDDRDDQKYRSRLERLLGPRLAATAPVRGRLTRLADLLRHGLRRADHVWFVTPEDVWDLAPATTGLLPNVPYWEAPSDIAGAAATGPVVLFVGIRDHLPNVEGVRWFVSRVWPQLRARVPGARLRVVGRGDWAGAAADMPGVPGVEWVGEVDDLATEYAAARLAICPVREGGGSKIKLIEAAAFARPVVATPHALRGFHGAGLEHVAGAAGAEAFAGACAGLLEDADLAQTTGIALRRWQQEHYSRGAFTGAVARVLGGGDARTSGGDGDKPY